MRARAASTNSRLVVRPAARSAASVARVGLVCAITLLLCPLRPLAGGEGGDPSLPRRGGGGERRPMLWHHPTSPQPSPPLGAEREGWLRAHPARQPPAAAVRQ